MPARGGPHVDAHGGAIPETGLPQRRSAGAGRGYLDGQCALLQSSALKTRIGLSPPASSTLPSGNSTAAK